MELLMKCMNVFKVNKKDCNIEEPILYTDQIQNQVASFLKDKGIPLKVHVSDDSSYTVNVTDINKDFV